MNENEEQVAIVPNLREFVLAMAKTLGLVEQALTALERQVAKLENRLIALQTEVDEHPVGSLHALIQAIGELRTRLEWLEGKR